MLVDWMQARTRLIVIVLAVLSLPIVALSQGRGRGGDPGQRGGGGGGGGQGRGVRGGGFPQYTRESASQDIIVRGKSLYEENCANCHAADLRGGPTGPNLLRAGATLNDQKGELIGASVARHTPALTFGTDDTGAIAEYIHNIQSTMGRQGSPPGRNPVGLQLNLLVGDSNAGATQFADLCASCHSVTGDLKGIGSRFPDARNLQNAWFSGAGGDGGAGAGGGRGGGGGAGNTTTVTLADNTKLEGTLALKNDFLVI